MADNTDLHAVLYRMDQLEKLVVSQAREIDNLKRIVSTNPALNPNNINLNHHQHLQQQFAHTNTAINFTNPPPSHSRQPPYSLATTTTNHVSECSTKTWI